VLDADRKRRWFAFTTQAARSSYDVAYAAGDVLVFGCETKGLPEDIVEQFAPDSRLRIPMQPKVRSLNLSNAVAIAVYEAWRQCAFALDIPSARIRNRSA
jgi:tRNA (cytidine/uridine-2'-O-)-methyltransferase